MAQAFRIISQSDHPASYPPPPETEAAHVVQAVGPCIDLPAGFGFFDILSPRTVAARLGEAIAASQADGRPVVLYLNSHGGGMEGIEALAQYIAGSPVPVHCYVAGGALSAGYYIAAACASITLAHELVQVGSVGAYVHLVNDRPAYRRAGVVVEDIYADQSTRKNLPYREALEGDYARLRHEVLNPLVDSFVGFVAARRPEARAEEFGDGRVFAGPDAVAAGLADGVEAWEAYVGGMAPVEATPQAPDRDDAPAAAGELQDGRIPDLPAPQAVEATPLDVLAVLLGYEGMETDDGGVYLSEDEVGRLAGSVRMLQVEADRYRGELMRLAASSEAAMARLESVRSDREHLHEGLQLVKDSHEAERQGLIARIETLTARVAALEAAPAEESAGDGMPPSGSGPGAWRDTFRRMGW